MQNVSCAWKLKGAIAIMTPVRPPSTNVASPPMTNRIGTDDTTRPTSNVARQQKNCTPVGIATACDAAEKNAREIPGNPVVNIWWTHRPNWQNLSTTWRAASMEVKSSSGMLIDDARGEMAGRGNAAPQPSKERAEDRTLALQRNRQ